MLQYIGALKKQIPRFTAFFKNYTDNLVCLKLSFTLLKGVNPFNLIILYTPASHTKIRF